MAATSKPAGRESLFSAADEWLAGLEDTFASPNRECSHEDTDKQGNREGNSCIEAELGDLEFPDDWCERCYVLYVTRQARASLRGEVTAWEAQIQIINGNRTDQAGQS